MKNKKLFAILTLVCFMLTLMPVAAFATPVVDQSAFVRYDNNEVIGTTTSNNAVKAATFYFNGKAASGAVEKGTTLGFLVWAVDANGVVSSALSNVEPVNAGEGTAQPSATYTNAYEVVAKTGDTFKLEFARKGVYTVYAGVVTQNGTATANLANAQLLGGSKTAFDTVTVIGTATDPQERYRAAVVDNAGAVLASDAVTPTKAIDDSNIILQSRVDGIASDGETMATIKATPNNVSETYKVKLAQSNVDISTVGKKDNKDNNDATISDQTWDSMAALSGMTVKASTNSANITLDQETYKANVLGQIELKLSASREGNYEIYLEANGVEFVIAVACGNTQAAYIETTEEPDALVALYESDVDVEFTITDINGNMVKDADTLGNGANGLYGLDGKSKVKYLFFSEKPASSTLTNSDLSLYNKDNGEYELQFAGTLDAEGKYTVKAILDNGAFATASWEVKRFQTPVELKIDAPSTVELGTAIELDLYYVDANGVEKKAKDAKLAATGYAIYSFDGKNVQLKTDEKYAGSKVTLTAVSERYDLVASKEVTIAAEAVAIAFAEKSLAVDVNNKVVWNVVDTEGNEVTLDNKYNKLDSVKYVILDKPEGAKVSVYDLTEIIGFDGEGKMALTSNKVGNVAVQVIAQVQVTNGEVGADVAKATQTKYYTGTQIFAVGNGSVGDVVVMSIGSNEIIINDAKATIDAAPIVQNDRTYVPFRALAEAFGATVAYDEATQAVTAELNGVTVVMTIGSATYTVNGAEKTMDVAPFINGSRTMVPVRFVAEAFGIKVIPTYDENGATADILFNL